MFRNSVLCAALMVALSCVRPAMAVEYNYDKSYQFPDQTSVNSGRGLAANGADTRLFAISRGSASSVVHILDPSSGAPLGTITPTALDLNDVSLSADESSVYLACGSTSTNARIESAPATGGAAAVLIADLGSVPLALAVLSDSTGEYLGIATRAGFQLWKKVDGTWSRIADKPIFPDVSRRDITALGSRFYVLTPSAFVSGAVAVYSLTGTVVNLFWDEIPDTVGNGYVLQSITSGTVDGAPALFLAGDTLDDSFSFPRLTVFRFTPDGEYSGDGFGFDLSSVSTPLGDLAPMETSDTLVPMTFSANHVYVGAVISSGSFADLPQTVRVTVNSGVVQPATVQGTVFLDQPPTPQPQENARVYLDGRDAYVLTSADGKYAITDVTPGANHLVGTYRMGYAAKSRPLSLTSGQTAVADFLLAELVPIFKFVQTTIPPVVDGIFNAGEYVGSPMAMSVMDAGVRMDGSVVTTGYATYDAQNLYVAVVAREPNAAFNVATAVVNDQSVILSDDSAQIYIDPLHRHDVPGSSPGLYQFAVNVPPQGGTSYRLERKIHPDGTVAEDLPPSAWTSALGYTLEGWVLEARIPLATLGISTPFTPDGSTEWGMLIARRRPQSVAGSAGHVDNLPSSYSTSCSQVGAFTNPNPWMDIRFTDPQIAPLPGDVNGNRIVDTQDAVFVLRVQAGLTYSETGACADLGLNLALGTGDVYPKDAPDGRLTMLDALRLLRVITGMDSLP